MNIIEKLEQLQRHAMTYRGSSIGHLAIKWEDLRAIIEEAKKEERKPFGYLHKSTIDATKNTRWSEVTCKITKDCQSEYGFSAPLFTHPPLSDETVKVPEGYALVPIYPSESMLNAALNGTPYKDDNKELMLAAYKAMIDEAMKADNVPK